MDFRELFNMKEDGKFGVLVGTGIPPIPISRHSMDGKQELYSQAAYTSHPNYLPFLFFDHRGGMIHHHYDSTLREHLAKLKVDEIEAVLEYEIPVYDDLLPQGKRKKHECASIPYRTMMKELFQFIFDQHAEGFYLTPFGIDNIVVVNGILNYVRVGFKRATPQETREQLRRENYDHVMGIIWEMFGGRENLPPPLRSLDDVVYNLPFTSASDGLLVLNHLALMSPVRVLLFAVALFERGKFFRQWEDKKRMNYVKALGTERKIGPDNLLLIPKCEEWLDWFINDDGYYYISKWAKLKCDLGSLTTSGPPVDVRRDIIRMCRNMAVHLKDFGCLDRHGSVWSFSEEEVAMIIMEIFGNVLYPLQYRLHRFGCLQTFLND